MSWFHKISHSSEYWIMDGQSVMADSSIGDSHESIVINQIYENHGLVSGCLQDPDARLSVMRNYANKLPLQGADLNNPDDPIVVTIGTYEILSAAGFSPAEVAIVNGRSFGDMTDARDYGMKMWGYKRVEHNNIETWTLSPADLKSISRGIDDILENDGHFDDGQNEFDPKYNIYVHANKKWLRDVPLSKIEEGDPYSRNLFAKAFNWYRNG